MTHLVITRPLSPFENFFRLRTVNSFYSNFQVTATYSNSLADFSLLGSALRQVFLDYHILACNIFPDHKDFVIRPVDCIRLRDVVEDFSSRHDLLTNAKINEKAMKYVDAIEFDLYVHKPLFKLILLPENNLVALFEHTLADGLVGPYFHEILVKYLANEQHPQPLDLDSEIFNYAKDVDLITHSLPPPIDPYVADYKLPYDYGDPGFYAHWKPEGYTKYPGRFPNAQGKSIAFKLVDFTPEETKTILAKCKQEQITMTIFIELVHAVTFKDFCGEYYTTYRVAMAMRRWFTADKLEDEYQNILEPGYKILGNSPSLGVAQHLPPLDDIDWDFARKLNSNLLKSANNERLLNLMKGWLDIYDPASEHTDYFESSLGKNRMDTAKLSNLGLVKVPVYKNNWTITNLVFSQNMSCSAGDLQINVISSNFGGLSIVLSHFDADYDDTSYENLDGFVAAFKANMLSFAQTI